MCVRKQITYSCDHQETTSLEPCALWWKCGDCAGDETLLIDTIFPCLRCQAEDASNEEQDDTSTFNEQVESLIMLPPQLTDGEWYIVSQDDLAGYSAELEKATDVQGPTKVKKCLQWADYKGEKLISLRFIFSGDTDQQSRRLSL